MSYNYDLNPWDDNYQASPQNVQQQQPIGGNYSNTGGANAGYTSSASGYTNPAETATNYTNPDAAWSDTNPSTPYGGINDYSQQAHDETYHQQQQQQTSPQQQQAPLPPPPSSIESVFKRFLRAHVPLCGSCMDLTSAICTPVLDTLLKHVNRELLVSKIFYFFFYSAFGSLFPLMGVYFKQLGMNPAQVGILTGVRPFIEIFSAPFWSGLADRFQKSKVLLLFSLISWIVFTYSLAHIRPPASACVAFNDTDYVLYTPYSANDLSNYDVGGLEEQQDNQQQAGSRGQNEVFMTKMPQNENDEESKDKLLAVEENQSVQGSRRRRRRKRQIQELGSESDEGINEWQAREQLDRPSISRYVYSVDGGDQSKAAAAALDNNNEPPSDVAQVDFDLESDFDDRPLVSRGNKNNGLNKDFTKDSGSDRIVGSQSQAGEDAESFFGQAQSDSDLGTGDTDGADSELKSSQGKALWRYKRLAPIVALGQGDYDQEAVAPSESENEKESEQESHERDRHGQHQQRDGTDASERDGDGDEDEGEPENGTNHAGGSHSENQEPIKENERVKEVKEETRQGSKDADGGAENEERQKGSEAKEAAMLALGTTTTTTTQTNRTKKVYKQRHKTPPTHIVGMSPITVQYAVNYNKEKHGQFVTPMFSTIVYKLDDIKEVFFLLLLLISLGEFFSAPAITIADNLTLQHLGENTDLYGRQRMFGSVGWAITLLLVGMALDNSTFIADHPCGPHQRERNYTVCYTIFSLLMGCAFVTATQFNFIYGQRKNNAKGGSQTLVTSTTENDQIITTTAGDGTSTNVDDLYASTRPREIFNTAPPVNAPPPGSEDAAGKEKFEFLDKWKSAMFAQRTREMPEWVNVFRQSLRHPMQLTYLFITWFLGCGVGLVFTFLFWHLQDVGGTPTLFGICSVINHISEVLAYFFSSHFIKQFGHTKVLSVGLGCNLIRFLYVAFLSNPYYALPFELVQGITHAACFAACCSYMSHVSKPELRTSTQGVMQGLHHGIGRACGTLIGGYMINAIGSRASFCIYGLLSGCVLVGFLYVRKKASSVDEDVKVDDNEALGGYGAPQGVPSAVPGKMAAQPVQEGVDYQW